MDTITVKYYSSINCSPAWRFVPKVEEELTTNCFLSFANPLQPDNDQVLIAFSSASENPSTEDLVGFLSYHYVESAQGWWINTSYVLPGHRQKGIHTLLFNTLVERAKARGDILGIECITHYNNHVAQAAFKKQGRVPVNIGYRFQVKEFSPARDPLDKAHFG